MRLQNAPRSALRGPPVAVVVASSRKALSDRVETVLSAVSHFLKTVRRQMKDRSHALLLMKRSELRWRENSRGCRSSLPR